MNVLVFHPFIASCIEEVRIKFIKINVEKRGKDKSYDSK